MTLARSSRRSACAATVPGKQIQAGCLPMLFSRSVSSPGFPRGGGEGRGAGGTTPSANPTQTNLVTFGAGSGQPLFRALAGPRKVAASKVRDAAEVPRRAPRRLSTSRGARDDGEAKKVLRVRPETAPHVPCDRHWVFSAAAQTL